MRPSTPVLGAAEDDAPDDGVLDAGGADDEEDDEVDEDAGDFLNSWSRYVYAA